MSLFPAYNSSQPPSRLSESTKSSDRRDLNDREEWLTNDSYKKDKKGEENRQEKRGSRKRHSSFSSSTSASDNDRTRRSLSPEVSGHRRSTKKKKKDYKRSRSRSPKRSKSSKKSRRRSDSRSPPRKYKKSDREEDFTKDKKGDKQLAHLNFPPYGEIPHYKLWTKRIMCRNGGFRKVAGAAASKGPELPRFHHKSFVKQFRRTPQSDLSGWLDPERKLSSLHSYFLAFRCDDEHEEAPDERMEEDIGEADEDSFVLSAVQAKTKEYNSRYGVETVLLMLGRPLENSSQFLDKSLLPYQNTSQKEGLFRKAFTSHNI